MANQIIDCETYEISTKATFEEIEKAFKAAGAKKAKIKKGKMVINFRVGGLFSGAAFCLATIMDDGEKRIGSMDIRANNPAKKQELKLALKASLAKVGIKL